MAARYDSPGNADDEVLPPPALTVSLQLVSSGTLRAQFDHDSKIDVLEFVTTSHCEYLSRHRLKALLAPHSPPDDKSPKQNKAAKTRAARQQPPPVVPDSHVNPYGVTPAVLSFLEVGHHLDPETLR